MAGADRIRVFEADKPAVSVYVMAPDGVLLDVIEDVDLGERTSAHERGRISLHEACLLAAVTTSRYRRATEPGQLVGDPGRDRGRRRR